MPGGWEPFLGTLEYGLHTQKFGIVSDQVTDHLDQAWIADKFPDGIIELIRHPDGYPGRNIQRSGLRQQLDGISFYFHDPLTAEQCGNDGESGFLILANSGHYETGVSALSSLSRSRRTKSLGWSGLSATYYAASNLKTALPAGGTGKFTSCHDPSSTHFFAS